MPRNEHTSVLRGFLRNKRYPTHVFSAQTLG